MFTFPKLPKHPEDQSACKSVKSLISSMLKSMEPGEGEIADGIHMMLDCDPIDSLPVIDERSVDTTSSGHSLGPKDKLDIGHTPMNNV